MNCKLNERDLSRIVAQTAILGVAPRIPGECVEALLGVARANRVGLEVANRLGLGDPVESERLSRATRLLGEVVEALKGLEFAVHKLSKPVLYGPVDVDLLVLREHLREALRRLTGRGFGVAASDPYSLTLVRGSDIVDLYVHPSTGWLVFMDGARLLEHVEARAFNGVEAPMLEEPAEAAVTAAHAVYKELMVNVNDAATLVKWGGRKAEEVAEEHSVLEALRYAYRVSTAILEGVVAAPYRIPLPLYAALLAGKLCGDPVARRLAPRHFASIIGSGRYARTAVGKLTRRSY